jgi:hypothetical protein
MSAEREYAAAWLRCACCLPQVPLEGFKALQGMNGPQKFNIHKAYSDQDRLPSAHTWWVRPCSVVSCAHLPHRPLLLACCC